MFRSTLSSIPGRFRVRRSRHANSPRTAEALAAGAAAGLWSYRGITADGGRYAIVVNGQRRELTVEQAGTYLEWRDIAGVEVGSENLEDSLPDRSTILEFFRETPRLDVARLAIWHGLQLTGRTITDVAVAAGYTRKTLAGNLHLGRPPARREWQHALVKECLTAAAAALDLPPLVLDGPATRRGAVAGMRGRVEPAAAARLRAVALVEEAGLAELAAPVDVHHAFRARALLLARGETSRLVPADCVAAACAALADVLDQTTAVKIAIVA